MKLSNRLKKIEELITNNSFVLDVGCDHALLDIDLCLNRNNLNCLATDIKELPLKKAQFNIAKYNLQNKIKTELSDGLSLLTNDVTTIVISGMGGILIKDIILKDINKITNQTIIVCPNSDSDVLRSELKNYLELKEEYLVEDKYIYEILVFKKGKSSLTKKEILYGKYFKKDNLYYKYFNLKLNELCFIKKTLPKKYIKKRIELLKKIRDIKNIV